MDDYQKWLMDQIIEKDEAIVKNLKDPQRYNELGYLCCSERLVKLRVELNIYHLALYKYMGMPK